MMNKREKITIIGMFLVGLYLASNVVYIASARNNSPSNDGLVPKNPVPPPTYGFHEFFVRNELLYFLDDNNTIGIIDTEDLNQINKIGEYNADEFEQITNNGNVVCATEKANSINSTHSEVNMQILEFNKKNQLEKSGVFPIIREEGSNSDKHLLDREDGTLYWLQKEVYNNTYSILVINCTERTSPNFVTRYTTTLLELDYDSLFDFRIYEDLMYTLTSKESITTLALYDISQLTEPEKLGQMIPLHQSHTRLHIKDSFLCQAYRDNDSNCGVDFYNISNPSLPKYQSSIHAEEFISNIFFSGNYLYIGLQDAKILIYEQQLNANFTLKESFDLEIKSELNEYIGNGIIDSNRLYFYRYTDSLARTFSVVDISNPLQLTETIFGPTTTNAISLPVILVICELVTVLIFAYFYTRRKSKK